ncbi:TPA: hypothetical protein ACYLN4_000713 [Burkholderia lata]
MKVKNRLVWLLLCGALFYPAWQLGGHIGRVVSHNISESLHATDTSKDGAGMIYAEAISLRKIPAISDDDGCLWLIAAKDHKLMSAAVLDQSGKQICRPAT